MNFQYIVKVDKAKDIADLAFSNAKKSGEFTWEQLKRSNKISRRRAAEKERLNAVRRIVKRRLNKIHDQFPIVKNLPEFYQKLFTNNIDIDKYLQSYHSIEWSIEKIEELYKHNHKEIMKSGDPKEMTKLRNNFYARTDSILKKLQKSLDFLEETRKKLRNFPDLKTDLYTVALTGYPNVGKSSLLRALTTSEPEISNYSFTTKGLNTGYLIHNSEKIQIIDVPGTLDREKKNIIENNAILAAKHAADVIVFVIDSSETSGYSIDEQIKLLRGFTNMVDSEPLCIVNKTDVSSKEQIEKVEKKIIKCQKISAEKKMGIKALKKTIINLKKKREV